MSREVDAQAVIDRLSRRLANKEVELAVAESAVESLQQELTEAHGMRMRVRELELRIEEGTAHNAELVRRLSERSEHGEG